MKKYLAKLLLGSSALAVSMSFLPLADANANNFADTLAMENLSKSVYASSNSQDLLADLSKSVHFEKAPAYTNAVMSKEDKITLAARAAAATYRYMSEGNEHLSKEKQEKAKKEGEALISSRLTLGEQYVFGGENIESDKFSQGGHIFYKWNKETGRHELSVAFRGTETGVDWGYNFDAGKVKKVTFAGKEMTLHAGFYKRYMAMRGSLTKNLNKVLLEKGITDFSKIDVTITGHSLGGGLAGIGAVDLKYYFDKIATMHNSKPVTSFDMITFAQPRFAGKRTAKWITEYLGTENITRIWGGFDPVAAVGLGVMGYKHVGSSGGYMLDNFSWFASSSIVSIHSMTNYLNAIMAKQELVSYKGKAHGFVRQTTRAASAVKDLFASSWKKIWA